MKSVALIAAMGAAIPAQADMYKCNEGGKVVYADQPCASNAERVRVYNNSNPSAEDAAAADAQLSRLRQQQAAEDAARDVARAAEGQRAADRLAYAGRAREAVQSHRVFVGMTAEDARKSWGEPTKINRTITAGSTNEQWVYRRGPGAAQYLYVDDGVVRSIQD